MVAGRRRHERFALAERCTGALRVLSDAVIQRAADGSLLAITHAPGVAQERLTLDLAGAAGSMRVDVEVAESRPIIVNGSVRHRLRLLVRDPDLTADAEAASVVA